MSAAPVGERAPVCACCGADDGLALPWFYSCGPEVVFDGMCDACRAEILAAVEVDPLSFVLRPVAP